MTLSGLDPKGTMDVYRSGPKGDYGCIQVWAQRGLWMYTGLGLKGTMSDTIRSRHKRDYGCDYGCIQVWVQR